MSDAASDRNPQSQTIEFAGHGDIRLVADAYGDREAPPVLFLHGGGQTRHAWGAAAARLAAQGWYAVTLDLRGHGDSDWSPDGKYRSGRWAGDVRAVAQQFEQPPVAIGASLGGLSAMMAEGGKRQSVLRGLVMVDVVVRMERAGLKRIVGFMRSHPEGFESLEQAADAISEYLPHRTRPDDLSGLTKNLRQRDDGRWVWHWDPRFMRRSYIGMIQSAYQLLRAHRHLHVPTLLVRGLKSEVVSDVGIADFQKRVPHAEYCDVRGAGHMVAGDKNDAFNDAVSDWLARTFPT